jgi:hypothetical protein
MTSVIAIMRWIGEPHSVRDFHCLPDLNQIAASNSRTVLAGVFPVIPILHEFRPEREKPALGWFNRVDGTARVFQEVALRPLRLS